MTPEEELKHPNNKLWQEQGEKRYKKNIEKLKGNISKMNIDEIIEQKNIVLEMKAIFG